MGRVQCSERWLYGREVLQKPRLETLELLSKNLGSPIERETEGERDCRCWLVSRGVLTDVMDRKQMVTPTLTCHSPGLNHST